ncbi:hypothetical protein GLYMA_20G195800v4 [Glycine max]|uniref:Uncharacterized protein n=1 Tax=Glycine max TaxID=3847 RepID=A0A0R0EPY2_SOYBN|nr:hypothetical protein GYH30_056405 [Glycine max]KRG92179.1 hypothetical protein GLYMA_20G195800v4 [Glycine max]
MEEVDFVVSLFPEFKFKKFYQPPGIFFQEKKIILIFVPGWQASFLLFSHLLSNFSK